jgi:hypothetical protein
MTFELGVAWRGLAMAIVLQPELQITIAIDRLGVSIVYLPYSSNAMHKKHGFLLYFCVMRFEISEDYASLCVT